jgi:hypothetical protein
MAMASPAAALLLLRPPSCLTSVCASRTPLLAVAIHRVKYRKILRGSAREFSSSFLGTKQLFSAVGSSAARAQEQEAAGDDSAWGGHGAAVCFDDPRT